MAAFTGLLDRVALARQFNDYPSDSIIPSAVSGFGTAHVYPLRGNLAAARRFAGHGAHHAVLYLCTNGPFGGNAQTQPAQAIRAQLARIGIIASITAPRIGFFGLILEWVDVVLICRLSKTMPS